jgi:DNA-binding transcriptional LysR family regulator
MRDRLEGVAVFVETVEAGGFSRAAERLALSRSAVGKTVARLETRLGVRLFNRTTRVQALTEEGLAYYERCQRALAELRAGESFLESGRTEVIGSLRMSMPVLFGRHCVAPILLEMARAHPKLELDLHFSDLRVDIVAEGFNLAIRNGPTAEGAGLRTRKLISQMKIVCAAPAYIAQRGTPSDIGDLLKHDALVYWRNNELFPWHKIDAEGRLVECPVNWRLKFDNMEAIVDAAVAGMGVAFVPDWLVRDHIKAGRLVPLLTDFASLPMDTFAVWPETEHVPMRVRLAIDMLVSQLPAAAVQ